MEIDPNAQVGSLPLATRQLVEVAKALSRAHVKLLILDEPTAALTETEAQVIFDRLRKLRDQGLHIIYITHRLQEVFEIADRVTVLRDGKVALAGKRVANLDAAAVVTAIAGARVVHPVRDDVGAGAPVLTLRRAGRYPLWTDRPRRRCRRGGGAVRRARVGAHRIAGDDFRLPPADRGPDLVNGRPIDPRKPAAAIAEGIALVPADRLRQALLGELDAVDNVLLPSYARLALFGFRRMGRERRLFAERRGGDVLPHRAWPTGVVGNSPAARSRN